MQVHDVYKQRTGVYNTVGQLWLAESFISQPNAHKFIIPTSYPYIPKLDLRETGKSFCY